MQTYELENLRMAAQLAQTRNISAQFTLPAAMLLELIEALLERPAQTAAPAKLELGRLERENDELEHERDELLARLEKLEPRGEYLKALAHSIAELRKILDEEKQRDGEVPDEED